MSQGNGLPCCPAEEGARFANCRLLAAVFRRTTAPEYGIICTDNSRIFAFCASIGMSETWKVQRVCQTKWRMRLAGRIVLPWVTQGFSRASDDNTGEGCALFLCP